jgi:hypothetical protein
MERVALELHATGAIALRKVLRWRVLYVPALPIRYSVQEFEPLEGRRIGAPEQHESMSVSQWRSRYRSYYHRMLDLYSVVTIGGARSSQGGSEGTSEPPHNPSLRR